MLVMKGWDGAINTLLVRRPQPHNINPKNERRKWKTGGDKKGASSMAH